MRTLEKISILVDLENIDKKSSNLKELLATIAGLSPLIYEASTIELLSKSFNIEKHDLILILDDFQKYGFIISY